MKTIIAGSRHFCDPGLMERFIFDSVATITPGVSEVVSGVCHGADLLGEAWAKAHGIPVKRFPADWARLGHSAGPIRNSAMAEYADALIAFPEQDSKGTRDMIHKARSNNLLVFVCEYVRG